MASMESSDDPSVSADGVVSADPASSATEMTTIDQSYGQSYSALRVTSGEPDWDNEINNNAARLVAMTTSALPQEPCVKFIAQDETNTDWTKSRLTYSLSLSSAITDLCSCIAKEAGYADETFDLIWRRQDVDSNHEEEIPLYWNSTATLHETGMPAEPQRCYLLIREKADGTPPKRLEEETQGGQQTKKVSYSTELSSARSVSATTDSNILNNNNNTINTSASNYRTSNTTATSSGSWYHYKYNAKSDTGFVGLVNQAMTCYLNSLLQTLYMTPEFRNALYHWEFGGNREEGSKSIPYQLQRLFLHLQTSDKRAVETTDVTKSFGWDSSEAWQQHDVQELCRVMFDALEKRFKKDGYESSKDLINDLYQGNMKDYVKCLECGYESAREDSFLDVPLVIRPFGSTTTHSSVKEALTAFVQPETLEGDNQYFCEQCNKKCNAHKGLKFKKFPYLLTLQLKRFDFDYSTMHRIKLNDRMTFPNVLDLNGFVNGDDEPSESSSSGLSEQELLEMYGDFVVEKFDQKPPPYSTTTYATPTDPTPSPDDDTITGEKVAKLLTKGPYVYELFSIMVHSGSAIGGHYYAYIKSFSDRQWYCFNDQSVSRITHEDLEQTFGGSDNRSRGYYSAVYASSANAYMLMYRRIDKTNNGEFTLSNGLPEHIVRQIEEEREAERREQERQEWERNLCKFRLFCRHPVTKELVEKRLEVHKDITLRDTIAESHKLHNLEGVVPVDRCRLVRYDEYTETLDQSFDESKDLLTFGDHVGGARTYYSFELFLEIRGEGEEFRPYNKGGLNLKVLIIDLPEGSVREPILVRGEQTWKVQDLKTELAKRYSLDESTMNLALETYNNDGKHLTNPNSLLKNEGFYRRHTVFVCCDPEDYARDFGSSDMYQVIDKHANSILLYITVPPPPRKAPRSTQPHKLDDQSNDSNVAKDFPDNDSKPKITESAVDKPTDDGDVFMTATELEARKNAESAAAANVGMANEGDRPLQKTIDLRIDRRCTLAELKTRLEEYVHVPSSEFKVYRIYSNNQEYEMFRVQDTLQPVPNETKMVVRLGRALKPGEFRVKLSLLEINEPEFFKPLLDSIVAKGMTVRQFKEQVVEEAYEQGVDVKLNADRMRLRKKTWRSPCTIFLDSQVFDRDIHVFANFEIYIECLDGPDEMKEATQMQVYVRHWHPSSYAVDKTQEIILSDNSPEHLKINLSQLSGIPVERVEFAKAYGSFPCEMSVLDIESELEWNPTVTTISSMPLSIYDDGSILYFKDSKESLAELTSEKRSDVQKQENARLSKYNITTTTHNYHHRREKELKIKSWTEDDDLASTEKQSES